MSEEAEALMVEVKNGEEALQSLKDGYTDYPPAKGFLWDRLDAPWLKQQAEVKAAYAQGVEDAAKVACQMRAPSEDEGLTIAAAIRALIKPETAK